MSAAPALRPGEFEPVTELAPDREASASPARLERPEDRRARAQELQERIRRLEARTLGQRPLATHPALAALLPGGSLQQGVTYSLAPSAMLLNTLLAAPSASGAWCAVVGLPEFGVEAAARAGVELSRLVLVPEPGEQWLRVTVAVIEVMGVVVLRPPKRATEAQLSQLATRLRSRGSTLFVLGPWPQSEAMLSLSESRWHGIGAGHGHLSSREVTVTVTHRSTGRPRSARLWMPDTGLAVRRSGSGVDAGGEAGIVLPLRRAVPA